MPRDDPPPQCSQPLRSRGARRWPVVTLLFLSLVDALAMAREVGAHDVGVSLPGTAAAAASLMSSDASRRRSRRWRDVRPRDLAADAPRHRLMPSNCCTKAVGLSPRKFVCGPSLDCNPDAMAHNALARQVEPRRWRHPNWRRRGRLQCTFGSRRWEPRSLKKWSTVARSGSKGAKTLASRSPELLVAAPTIARQWLRGRRTAKSRVRGGPHPRVYPSHFMTLTTKSSRIATLASDGSFPTVPHTALLLPVPHGAAEQA